MFYDTKVHYNPPKTSIVLQQFGIGLCQGYTFGSEDKALMILKRMQEKYL